MASIPEESEKIDRRALRVAIASAVNEELKRQGVNLKVYGGLALTKTSMKYHSFFSKPKPE